MFAWCEEDFLKNTEGSAIRRIGYQRWLRNIAVALGNLLGNIKPGDEDIADTASSKKIIKALQEKKLEFSHNEMLAEHIDWALQQLA
jgi:epoxyqueuosine reductase